MASFIAILVFGLLFLLYLLSLAISTLMPWILILIVLVGSVIIGLFVDKHSKYPIAVILLPFLFLVLPAAWGVSGYKMFTASCEIKDSTDFVSQFEAPQEGFLLDLGAF